MYNVCVHRKNAVEVLTDKGACQDQLKIGGAS